MFTIGPLVLFITKIFSGEESLVKYRAKHLDPIFIEQSSVFALGQAKEEIIHMGEFGSSEDSRIYRILKTNQQKNAERPYQMEEVLNNLDYKITSYLVELSASSLSET